MILEKHDINTIYIFTNTSKKLTLITFYIGYLLITLYYIFFSRHILWNAEFERFNKICDLSVKCMLYVSTFMQFSKLTDTCYFVYTLKL